MTNQVQALGAIHHARTHPTSDTCGQLAYCGFYDRANIGDYALFKANELLFPALRLVDAHAPATANLFGGGTMFPYSLRYGTYPRRATNVAVGLGVSDPDFDGPFGWLTRVAMTRWRFQWFGVRGERSRRILERHGIPSEVTGDTALVHRRPSGVPTSPDLVALNLVGEDMKRFGSGDHSLGIVRDVATRLQSAGKRLLLVPFCNTDRVSMQRLHEHLGPDAEFLDFWGPEIGADLERFLRALSRCEFMIGERLHAIVLAAALDIPFVGLAYKPKCYDFAESIGLSRLLLNPNTLTAARLERGIVESLSHRHDIVEEMRAGVSLLRRRLDAAGDEITARLSPQ
jgi:polysaccharide pyruvyl transferase WcaK-like protein